MNLAWALLTLSTKYLLNLEFLASVAVILFLKEQLEFFLTKLFPLIV